MNFKKSSTIISGLVAVGIYVLLLFLLLFYFNARDKIKPVHYVKKNEDKIRVSLASEPTKSKIKAPARKPKEPEVKAPKISKPKPKKKETVKKIKDTSKKIIKEKVVKKVKPKKKPKEKPKEKPKKTPKKVNAPKSLFENIKIEKKPKEKAKEKPKKQEKPKKIKPIVMPKRKSASEMLSESMKEQKSSDSGIENAYLARIEERLTDWPAQSEYAGETVKIRIKVHSTGKFSFKILRHSANFEFNNSLKAYLKQLQDMGFGRHKSNRPYTIDVEFEAKE